MKRSLFFLFVMCTNPIASQHMDFQGYLALLRSRLKNIPDELYTQLTHVITTQNCYQQKDLKQNMKKENHVSLPLFDAYPALRTTCPYIELGTFPTPIEQLKEIGQKLNHAHLYIKRDDRSGMITKNGTQLFGGNKVRKLGFLLADAKQNNFDTVITFGGAGSNHALCTATYAQQCGLKCLLHLEPQPNSQTVQRNLLLGHYHQAQIREYEFNELDEIALFNNVLENYLTTKKVPYLIPIGGSNALGAIGFVNAAFELKKQIEQGLIPEPDYIYLPFGSMGTTAGLLVGLQTLGLKTKIRAIKISHTKQSNKETCYQLARETHQLLQTFDPNFPPLDLDTQQLDVVYDFIGPDYGQPTKQTNEAITLFKETQNLNLDVTYTGKAMAALLHDIQTGYLKKNDVVLFWNTYCGDDFADIIACIDHQDLPTCFHKYFAVETD